MKVRVIATLVVLLGCVALLPTWAEDKKADKKAPAARKIGGAFQVKAITGANKGKTLCYVWKYNGEARAAVVVVFSQKVDDNIASLVKSIDQVQKNNEKLGAVLVGISGVEAADLEKLQDTHKLTTPLTIAEVPDGPKSYKLDKSVPVTVLIYKKGGTVVGDYTFKDTKSAADKASDIAAALEKALK